MSADKQPHLPKQTSCGPLYTHSEPPTPKMKTSVSFTYFSPPPSSGSVSSSTSNSPNNSLRYSPLNDRERGSLREEFCDDKAGISDSNSLREDTSSASESKADSDITNEDFDDLVMRKQWLEWEAISRKFSTDEDFLEQETLV